MSENASSSTSNTNWERVDLLADEQIDVSDAPPLDEGFFSRARWRFPAGYATVAVPVDPDTLSWFKDQGESAEEQMAAALRIYAEAQKVGRSLRRGTP